MPKILLDLRVHLLIKGTGNCNKKEVTYAVQGWNHEVLYIGNTTIFQSASPNISWRQMDLSIKNLIDPYGWNTEIGDYVKKNNEFLINSVTNSVSGFEY